VASGVRFHIKALVFDWLGGLAEPTREEWRIVEPLLDDLAGDAAEQAWGLLYRQPWFEIADYEGAVESRLRSEDERVVDRMIAVLRAAQQWSPARVAELVEPFVGLSEMWNRRLVALAQWSDLGSDRRFFDLVLRLIDEGVLDDARGAIASNADFWDVGYGLEERSEWAVEYIEHYLQRRLRIAETRGVTNPFDRAEGTIPDTAHNYDFFVKAAEGASSAYVRLLLPIFRRVIATTATGNADRLPRDPVWSYRYRDDRHGTDAALLSGMEHALQQVAREDPKLFMSARADLAEDNTDTTNFLLVRGLLGNPEVFSDEAASYLLTDERRLRAGYMDDDHWATRELIAAIFPYLSEALRGRLEAALLHYATPWEMSADGYRERGYSQFVLLSSVAPAYLSDQARRRIAELQRKFGRDQPSPPRGIIGGFVGSPIPQAAAEKMNDEQWLGAIERYSGPERDWTRTDHGLRGGAEELAHELEREAKNDPRRFAELSRRIPDSAQISYFDAILRAVATTEDEVDEEIVGAICRRSHALPGRPCGRWITDPIGRLATTSEIPDDLVELVIWYAVNDPHPEAESWQEAPEGSASPYWGGDPYTAGINSVRGSAAETLAYLVAYDRVDADRLRPTLERLVRDPSVAVRSCVAQILLALLREHRELAVKLVLELVETDDALLATPHVERFLPYASRTHFGDIASVLRRMIDSDLPAVQQVGGRQAVMSYIFNSDAEDLADTATTHPADPVRLGAAQVASANIANADAAERLRPLLIRLFSDPEKDVRERAADAFRAFKDLAAGEYNELLSAFVESPAFGEGASHLFWVLDEARDPPVEATIAACERFASLLLDEGDPFSARGLDADHAAQILLRSYQATTDEELRARCLDTIDLLSRLRTYGLDKALAAFER
jgi:hypothetical protein